MNHAFCLITEYKFANIRKKDSNCLLGCPSVLNESFLKGVFLKKTRKSATKTDQHRNLKNFYENTFQSSKHVTRYITSSATIAWSSRK